ncbi:MAG: radical SAM protein [Deltaproteobacteria bacterium]|nr:radical SAM protein [Deltaproteobacteria bacterium]
MQRMQITTLSVMAGSTACNLSCPYCISKTTYRVGQAICTPVDLGRIAFLADKFLRVCSGLPFGIITGKGEPTLADPDEIGALIEVLYAGGHGLIPELQTNGVRLDADRLASWREKGLNTLALSCVSERDEVNSQILSGGRVSWKLGELVERASGMGLLVRLTVILTRGGVDDEARFLSFMRWAKSRGAQQVTFRRMGAPRDLAREGSQRVADWIDQNRIEPSFLIDALEAGGREQDPLPWAQVFTYDGLSVVVTDHMNPPRDNMLRHAIIQPDGHLYGSWDDPGNILI